MSYWIQDETKRVAEEVTKTTRSAPIDAQEHIAHTVTDRAPIGRDVNRLPNPEQADPLRVHTDTKHTQKQSLGREKYAAQRFHRSRCTAARGAVRCTLHVSEFPKVVELEHVLHHQHANTDVHEPVVCVLKRAAKAQGVKVSSLQRHGGRQSERAGTHPFVLRTSVDVAECRDWYSPTARSFRPRRQYPNGRSNTCLQARKK